MTDLTTSTATATRPTVQRLPLWLAAVGSGVIAAGASVLIAFTARSAGIDLNVGGEPIPLNGFATMTLLCTLIGYGLAAALRRWTSRPRRALVATTVTLTVLSLIPDLIVEAATATRLVLMLTHLVAAAVVIPALAAGLPARRPSR